MSGSTDLLRLSRRWLRTAAVERKIFEGSAAPSDSKARSYGAWLAYRECAYAIKKLAENK